MKSEKIACLIVTLVVIKTILKKIQYIEFWKTAQRFHFDFVIYSGSQLWRFRWKREPAYIKQNFLQLKSLTATLQRIPTYKEKFCLYFLTDYKRDHVWMLHKSKTLSITLNYEICSRWAIAKTLCQEILWTVLIPYCHYVSLHRTILKGYRFKFHFNLITHTYTVLVQVAWI